MSCDIGKATEGLENELSCDVGEATERLENELSCDVGEVTERLENELMGGSPGELSEELVTCGSRRERRVGELTVT